MKIGVVQIFIFLLLTFILLENFYEPLRYLKYILTFILLFLYFFIKKAPIKSVYSSYLLTFFIFYLLIIFYLFIKVLIFDEYSNRFLANTALILFPLISIIMLVPFFKEEDIGGYVRIAFYFAAVVFVFLVSKNLFVIILDFSKFKKAVFSSEIVTENQLAFIFGLFLFYFIVEKKSKMHIILCAIMFVVSFKRIAIVAFAVSFVLYYLSTSVFKFRAEKNKLLITLLALLINFLFIQIVFVIVSGGLDIQIEKYTNLSANQFLMGRQNFYKTVLDVTGNISWGGVGLGSVDQILFEKFKQPWNLHSDILKNYFQFGVIIFFLWIALLYLKTSFSNKSLSLLIYFNVLMLTDNIFIYFDFMFFFYLFVLIYLSQNPQLMKTGR